MLWHNIISFLKLLSILFSLLPSTVFCQHTNYINSFDYKNINTQTFISVPGLNDTQSHVFTLLKHSFETQHIISYPKDTFFVWNGLLGKKTMYSTDSLILFFLRPNDTLSRPCILLTHGNDAKYRGSWNEQMNFYTIDLVMRGYCVAYYENPSSFESKNRQQFNSTKKAFYNGFQSAVAAAVYITEKAADLKIDTTKLFSGGLSFGAFCSLALASAAIGENFTDTLFNTQGNFKSKSIYNTPYYKNIKHVFAIGGGLPKDDTIPANNSKMGNFLNENDSFSILFLHGRNDNLVSFDVTKFGTTDTVGSYFFVEGPRALTNNIHAKNLELPTKLFVNCKGAHPFLTTVCDYANPNCIQQYQWGYLSEPPNSINSSNPYFTNNLNDTLLHYFAFMAAQVDDIDFIISDFLLPAILPSVTNFTEKLYFLQPKDSFNYANTNGHYIFRNTDCEGNIIITSIENKWAKNEVKLYPNPSNNFIYFESNEIMQNIRIYSMLGILVKEIISNDLQQQIDVRNFSNSEYICIIQLKNEIITKKISLVR